MPFVFASESALLNSCRVIFVRKVPQFVARKRAFLLTRFAPSTGVCCESHNEPFHSKIERGTAPTAVAVLALEMRRSGSVSGQRKIHSKGRSKAIALARRVNGPALQFEEMADDCQAETEAPTRLLSLCLTK